MSDERQSWHDEHREIVEQLREIRRHQHTILHELKEIKMAISQAVQDVLAAIDTATDDVAAEIKVIIAQIVPGMPQADVDTVVAQLKAKADRLEAIAKDPNNPVPPVAPAQ